jgi:16S rRNA C967 or C1407 C5-methylase (RsmB/RsmF family)
MRGGSPSFRSFLLAFYDPDALAAPLRRALIRLDPSAGLDGVARLTISGLPDVFLVDDVLDAPTLDALAAADRVYLLSASSLLAPLNLAPEPGHAIFDACAAPGGKSLVAARFPGVHVTANEVSRARRAHMAGLFARVAPAIKVTGHDATDLRRLPFAPDRILLDAPCSSDEHVLRQGAEADWSEKRSKNLGSRQKALLMSCFAALAPGGRLVYATCTGSPHEDELAIARFLKRVGDAARLLPARTFGLPAEPGLAAFGDTDLGHVGPYVLRTRPEAGLSPAFVAVVEKST